MLTVPRHKPQRTQGKQKRALQQINPKPFSESLLMKKNKSALRFIKRLSPFLLSALLLPPFVLYIFIAGVHVFNSMWVEFFVFICAEVYLLFLDFVLWNYYEGKKIARIWAIELICECGLIYFLL